MRVRSAYPIAFIIVIIVTGGCARLHHQQPLRWRIVVELEQSLQDIEKATTLSAAIISRRLDLIDVQGAKVDVIDAKTGRIQIQLPEVADRERLKTFLTSGGKLEIVHVLSSPCPEPIKIYGTGNFTKASAEDLAQILMSGPLPSTLRIIEDRDN